MPTIPSDEHAGFAGQARQWMSAGHGPAHPGHHGGKKRRGFMHRNPFMAAFFMGSFLLCTVLAGVFVGATTRAADARKTMARLGALSKVPQAFTDEERAVLISKVKASVLGPF
jgi:hypothetical protein